jgi:hypothetical protein
MEEFNMKNTRSLALLTAILLAGTMSSYASGSKQTTYTCSYKYTYSGKDYTFTETRSNIDEAKKAADTKCKAALESHHDKSDHCSLEKCVQP